MMNMKKTINTEVNLLNRRLRIAKRIKGFKTRAVNNAKMRGIEIGKIKYKNKMKRIMSKMMIQYFLFKFLTT